MKAMTTTLTIMIITAITVIECGTSYRVGTISNAGVLQMLRKEAQRKERNSNLNTTLFSFVDYFWSADPLLAFSHPDPRHYTHIYTRFNTDTQDTDVNNKTQQTSVLKGFSKARPLRLFIDNRRYSRKDLVVFFPSSFVFYTLL